MEMESVDEYFFFLSWIYWIECVHGEVFVEPREALGQETVQ